MQKWYASDLLINHPYKCILHMFIGSACRHKVVGCLKKQYKAPKDAEYAYSDGQSTVRNPIVDPSTDEQILSQQWNLLQYKGHFSSCRQLFRWICCQNCSHHMPPENWDCLYQMILLHWLQRLWCI